MSSPARRFLGPSVLAALLTLVVGTLPACNRNKTPSYAQNQTYPQQQPGYYPQQPGYYPQQPGQYPQQPGQYPQQPGQYPQQPGQYPQQPGQYPQQQPQQPQQPQTNPFPGMPSIPGLPANTSTLNDPINGNDINWLRSQAGVVMGELIDALPADKANIVRGLPFIADPTPGEVNAFAACDDQGNAFMAITDGLFEIESYIAQFKANDETFGTHKLDEFLRIIAQAGGFARPPAGFSDPVQSVDPRKVNRQHQLFDEQVGFVLGHELGHHHLGHLGCTATNSGGGRGVTVADVGRVLSRALPLFNQPNELAADIAGTKNVLAAGARRQGYHLTENGALLTLQFFANLDQLTPATVVFGFESSHPHPLIRIPVVQNSAAAWRMTGGMW